MHNRDGESYIERDSKKIREEKRNRTRAYTARAKEKLKTTQTRKTRLEIAKMYQTLDAVRVSYGNASAKRYKLRNMIFMCYNNIHFVCRTFFSGASTIAHCVFALYPIIFHFFSFNKIVSLMEIWFVWNQQKILYIFR